MLLKFAYQDFLDDRKFGMSGAGEPSKAKSSSASYA